MQIAIATALVLFAAGCATRASLTPAKPSGAYETGQASYYSDRLAGRRTASGERYDPAALTAAHRRLPLGTVVEVVRPNGLAVRVRINDRGPYVAGRVIDLSRRAARALGMLRRGVAVVTLYVVRAPRRKVSARR